MIDFLPSSSRRPVCANINTPQHSARDNEVLINIQIELSVISVIAWMTISQLTIGIQ